MAKQLVGHIEVDTGLCWIGNPCYILHAKPFPKALGKDWGEFVGTILEGGVYPTMKSFNYDLGHEGLGVIVSTGLGDGTYPVYAEVEEIPGWGTKIKSVTIEFISELIEEEVTNA